MKSEANKMLFRVEVQISKVEKPRVFEPIGHLIVDTGAEVTWVDAGRLLQAGVTVEKQSQFVTATGEIITRDIGFAVIKHDEFQTVDEVVFAQPDDLQLLGARTIEGFNAVVEPTRKRLVGAGPIIAA